MGLVFNFARIDLTSTFLGAKGYLRGGQLDKIISALFYYTAKLNEQSGFSALEGTRFSYLCEQKLRTAKQMEETTTHNTQFFCNKLYTYIYI